MDYIGSWEFANEHLFSDMRITKTGTDRSVLCRNWFSGTIPGSDEPSQRNAFILTSPESPLDQFQTPFASHDRGWISVSLCQTFAARRSPMVFTGLAPPARAFKKLEARGNFVVQRAGGKFVACEHTLCYPNNHCCSNTTKIHSKPS